MVHFGSGMRLAATSALVLAAGFSAFFGLQEARFQHALSQVDSDMDPAPIALASRTLSLAASDSALSICDANFQLSASSLIPNDSVTGVMDQCLPLAQRILQRSPTHSFAHLVAAAAENKSGNHTAFITHIAASQRHGQFEGWLSQRRFEYLTDNAQQSDRTLLNNEIEAMLTFQLGAEILADRVRNDPALSHFILASVKSTDPVYQQRFINLSRHTWQGN